MLCLALRMGFLTPLRAGGLFDLDLDVEDTALI